MGLCDISFSQEADNDPTGEAAANTQQTLTFYELDLGLNHVVRKYSEALEEHGNFLITGTHLDVSLAHTREAIIGSGSEITPEISLGHANL